MMGHSHQHETSIIVQLREIKFLANAILLSRDTDKNPCGPDYNERIKGRKDRRQKIMWLTKNNLDNWLKNSIGAKYYELKWAAEDWNKWPWSGSETNGHGLVVKQMAMVW